MYYINAQPNATGNHGNPVSNPGPDMLALPDDRLADYIACKGFAILTHDGTTVTAVEVNQEALYAYLSEHPETPETEPEPTLEERMTAMETAIQAGLSL